MDKWVYLGVGVLIAEAILVGLGMIIIWRLIGGREENGETGSIYECGFMPYGEIRTPYAIKFMLVGILFMLFDVEIAYLYPWANVYGTLMVEGYWWGYIFIIIITGGLVYEWYMGGIEWL